MVNKRFMSTGAIDTKEFKIALRALGFEIEKEEASRIISKLDRDGSGMILYEDFERAVSQKMVWGFHILSYFL